MISEKLLKVLSKQVNEEWYASYLYLTMSADADRKGLKGFSNWLRVQAQEEMFHGMKIYDYILERGEHPEFSDVKVSEKTKWASLTEMFDEILKHEQKVTALINNIASIAHEEKDYATYTFNQWFVNEQVEEESSSDEILQTLKFVKEDPTAVYNMDKEFATRVFIPEVKA